MPATSSSFPLFRLLTGSLCISFSPIFIRLADIDPDLAGFYRMLFAGLSLLLLMLVRRDSFHIPRRPLLILLFGGIALGADFMCWHRSIGLVGPGFSTLLGNFQVFFTALFSWLLLRERITPLFTVAIILAFGGLMMITGVDVAELAGNVRAGIFFGILTAFFYSLYIMAMKQAMTISSISGPAAMLMISLFCTGFMTLVGVARGLSFTVTDGGALLALAGVGVLSTTIGWSLISTAMRMVPATLAGLVLLLQPALAMVWDVLIFQRPTGIWEVVGISLILTAIYLGSLRRESH